MMARLESMQRSKMDPITPSWKLPVADRRVMWLQRCHSHAVGRKLQLWASGAHRYHSDTVGRLALGCGRAGTPAFSWTPQSVASSGTRILIFT